MIELEKLMNYGFVIYQTNVGVAVKKIKTPKSPTDVLHAEVSPDCSVKDFANFGIAYNFCLEFIISGMDEANAKANLKECRVEVAFNPTGLSLKSAKLENVFATSYDEACLMGEKLAIEYLTGKGINVDDFEVQVRPVV